MNAIEKKDPFQIETKEIRQLSSSETDLVYGGEGHAQPQLIACTIASPEISTPTSGMTEATTITTTPCWAA